MLKNEFIDKIKGKLSFHDRFIFTNENEINLYDIKNKRVILPGEKVEMSVGEYMLNLAQSMGIEAREYIKESPENEKSGFKIDNKNFKLSKKTMDEYSYENQKAAENMFIQCMKYLREELSLNIIDEVLRMSSKNSNVYEDRKVEQLREMLNNYSRDKKLDFEEGDFSDLTAIKDKLINGQIYTELEMTDTMKKIIEEYLSPIGKDLEKYYESKKPRINFNWIENIESNIEQKIEKIEVEIFKDTQIGKELKIALKQDSIEILKKYVAFIFKNPKYHTKEDLIDIDITLTDQKKNYLAKSFDINWQLINVHIKTIKNEDEKEEIIKSIIDSVCECFETRVFHLEAVINLNKLVNNNDILSESTIVNIKDYINTLYMNKKQSFFYDVKYEDKEIDFNKEINVKALINTKLLNSLTMNSNTNVLKSIIKGVSKYKNVLSLRHCQVIRELSDRNIDEASESYRKARDFQSLKEVENEDKRLCLIFNENIIGQLIKISSEDKTNIFDFKFEKSYLHLLCKINKNDNELFNKILFKLIDSDIEQKDIWDDMIISMYENSKMKKELLTNVKVEDSFVSRKKVSKF